MNYQSLGKQRTWGAPPYHWDNGQRRLWLRIKRRGDRSLRRGGFIERYQHRPVGGDPFAYLDAACPRSQPRRCVWKETKVVKLSPDLAA